MAKTNKALDEAMARDEARIVEVKAIKAETLARNNAYKALLDYVTNTANVPEEVLNACKVIRPSYFGLTGTPMTGDGLTPAYRKLLSLTANPTAGDTWTEMDLFEKFRFGATEAKNWCNELVKLPVDGKPLVWIKFNRTERTYTVVAIQNETPEGWNGYLPKTLNNGKAKQATAK